MYKNKFYKIQYYNKKIKTYKIELNNFNKIIIKLIKNIQILKYN